MLPKKLLSGFPKPTIDLTRKDPVPGCVFSLQWSCVQDRTAKLTIDRHRAGLFYFLRIFDKNGMLVRATPKVVQSAEDEDPILLVLEKYL